MGLILDPCPSSMAAHQCPVRPLPLLPVLLLTFLPSRNSVLITDEEAALVAEVPKEIFCFSRTFMDLTCFWNESAQGDGAYRFFYTYKGDSSRECTLTSVTQGDGGWCHICIFPNDHLGTRLFIDLYIEVVNITSNLTMFNRSLSVETVGLIAPPTNITAKWPGLARQLHVIWVPPPIYFQDFLFYEVLYGVEGSTQLPSRIEVGNNHLCHLKGLLPGQRYRIQVRTKPDGISFSGFWGPWSPAVLAETPHLPENIGLQCFTPDLRQLHCQWEMEPGPSHSLLHWAEDNSSSARTQAWHKCEEKEERSEPHHHPHSHVCIFQPSNSSYISVLLTITEGQLQQEVSYFKEPFELHHVVFTAPPMILQATVERGVLKLEWATSLEELAAHMVYQIQYADMEQNTPNWKDLQVRYSTNTEIHHLAPGSHYCLQLRAQPDGQKFQGRWSAWSEMVCIEVPAGAGSTILNVAVALLLCAGLVLGVGCTCFSMYSVKQILWPPIPDFHHVLDGFLEDNKKQQQQVNAFFCNKTLEDTPLTCLLEVLSERPLETTGYGPFPSVVAAEQAKWDSQSSSHQLYMASSNQGSHQENEYFDSAGDGYDTLPMSLEHGSITVAESQLCSVTSLNTPLFAPETKEGRNWEASGEPSTSPTHISNQSYLLMG
ncbi:thrombopoietin receptor isoform X2 [Hemicordylus capensis]|uniref:thrombopoietin receptor isoform X2 n=1 Tax=Hemicordylus capensis TaxID=884348 RepID=UPI00230383CD|nr:thrombopoietin receptor isoform X2 [Hemicordylus capensis]